MCFRENRGKTGPLLTRADLLSPTRFFRFPKIGEGKNMFFFDSLLFRREKSAFVPTDEMRRVQIIDNSIDIESAQRGRSIQY